MEKQEYRIGDVADIVGLSRDALRFYETWASSPVLWAA